MSLHICEPSEPPHQDMRGKKEILRGIRLTLVFEVACS